MSEPAPHPLLRCPSCRGGLEPSRETLLHCPACNAYHPVIEGVPSFSDRTAYWGEEFDLAAMRDINTAAERQGWRAAVDRLVRPRARERAEYIEGFFRADWRFLLPVESDWRVVDVGAGWGTLSCALAEICSEVFALESAFERARFIRIRSEEDRAANVVPVHGSLTLPPLAEESFDLVALNGVLEWLGWADLSRGVARVQLDHLRTCWRLLKPGGWLYIGIENRFGISSWLGAMDHSYLKYTSLLPRPLAHAATRSLRGHSYRTYTYSPFGYGRLLSRAGFSDAAFYGALPTYSRPVYLWPLGNGRALRRIVRILLEEKPGAANSKLRLAAGLIERAPDSILAAAAHFLAPHLAIVARKEGEVRGD